MPVGSPARTTDWIGGTGVAITTTSLVTSFSTTTSLVTSLTTSFSTITGSAGAEPPQAKTSAKDNVENPIQTTLTDIRHLRR